MPDTADQIDPPDDWAEQFAGLNRAHLIGLLYTTRREIGAMREERDAWRTSKLAVPEAQAIAACVRALDAMNSGQVPAASAERVLDYLRSKYLGGPSARIEYMPPQTVTGFVSDDLRVGDIARFDLPSGTVSRVER